MSTSRRQVVPLALFSAALLVLTASSACDSAPSPERPDAGVPEQMGDAPVALATCEGSTNLVDRAVCPRLLADGCATFQRAEATTELCRRLFVDLTGTAPTSHEVASTCAGKSTDDVITALMKTPAYLRHAEELWAERLAYDPAQVDGLWLDDADRIVDELVTGRMAYDVFAARIVGHPVFGVGARLPRSDVLEDDARFYPQVAARATQLFLGRAPIAGEDVSLARLFSFWKKKIVVLNGDYGRAEPIVDPSLCPCESNALGATTRIELPLAHATPYADLVDLASTAGGRQVRSPALRAELDKAGALLAAQRPFWTQGADLALATVLGWWKSTANLDASMLPEIQVALSGQLRATRSWPEMVRTILTSALYTRTNRLEGGVDPKAVEKAPPWCSGPMRILRPEAYVSSLGHLLGVRVGRCDHRTYEPRGVYYGDGSEGSFFPNALREDEASDALALGSTDFHLTAVGAMGGCNAGAPRTEEATLAYVFGMAPAAAKICGASELVSTGAPIHDGTDASLARLADPVSMRLRARPTTAEERRALAEDVASCATHCSAGELATSVCTAIARSADFSTY